MKPELPKSIRNALASQKGGDTHPSADLLAAFAEHALSAGECEQITDHLSTCAECREAVFLASGVDEQLAAEPERASVAALKPRSLWMPWLAWGFSAIALVAMAAGVFIQQYLGRDRVPQQITQVAPAPTQQATTPPAPVPPPETLYSAGDRAATKKPASETQAKPRAKDQLSLQFSDVVAKKSSSSSERTEPLANLPPTGAANQAPGAVVGGSTTSFKVAAPMQNGFVEGRPSQALAVSPPAMPRAFIREGSSSKNWRIGAEGQLEHLSQTGWVNVLKDQTTKFRVVTEAPSGVWAGGSRGELFHSEDNGEHWSQIALPVADDAPPVPIFTIHFFDPQHGIVLTESGGRYITVDAGKNWTKE